MKQTPISALALLALSVTACGEDKDSDAAPSTGTLNVRIWGEEYIEDTIPAETFADGWSVRFDKFLLRVGSVRVGAETGTPSLTTGTTYRVYDLAVPPATAGDAPGHLVASAEVDAVDTPIVGYTVAGGGDAEAGNASPADTERLTQNGWAVYVEGVATKADVTKRFAWGFEGTQRYFPCESTATFTAGVAEVQLTIHGDHLFYDDLTAEEPNVAFDVVASADTDDDGEITVEELTARDITGEARYQVGSFPVTNLYAFIEHQIGTLGHIDGEGHCETGGE